MITDDKYGIIFLQKLLQIICPCARCDNNLSVWFPIFWNTKLFVDVDATFRMFSQENINIFECNVFQFVILDRMFSVFNQLD